MADENPILNNPYEEPVWHYATNLQGELDYSRPVIDDEAFSRIYGHQGHPFPVKKGQKIAVRVISQFGEETTKVLEVK